MGRYQKYQRKLKYITVLGSTGSIGTQTLEIASEHPDKFKAVALSAGRNINLLTEQVKTHKHIGFYLISGFREPYPNNENHRTNNLVVI